MKKIYTLKDGSSIEFAQLENVDVRTNLGDVFSLKEIKENAAQLLKENEEIVGVYASAALGESFYEPKFKQMVCDYIFKTNAGRNLVNFACCAFDFETIKKWGFDEALAFLAFLNPTYAAENPLANQAFAKRLAEKNAKLGDFIKKFK